MIRYAQNKDLDDLYRLTNVLEHVTLDYEEFKKIFEKAIEEDQIYIYEEDERTVAYLHMHMSPQFARAAMIAEIRELVVEEGCRGRGYGKKLLEKAVSYCEEQGIGMIEILSSLYRKDAHRFYEKNGFSITGYRFFNDGWEKGICLQKDQKVL